MLDQTAGRCIHDLVFLVVQDAIGRTNGAVGEERAAAVVVEDSVGSTTRIVRAVSGGYVGGKLEQRLATGPVDR